MSQKHFRNVSETIKVGISGVAIHPNRELNGQLQSLHNFQ